jgi:uncharacterized alpha-E superfamily protein
LPPPSTPVEISRDEADLPSRVADNLFWLGRYMERAEGTARLVRAVAARLADQSGPEGADAAVDAEPLVRMLEAQTYARLALGMGDGAYRADSAWVRVIERSLEATVFDTQPAGTLRATIGDTHRVARTLRDWLSFDAWRAVVHLEQELRRAGPPDPGAPRSLVDLLNRVITLLAAMEGLIAESMTHDQAWRFLDIGRRLERASSVVSLVRSGLGTASPREGAVLEALLEVASSTSTYRRRYLATLQVAPVIDLLLLDETNPRSALFQLEALAAHVTALPRVARAAGTPRAAQEKLVLSALAELRTAEAGDLCDPAHPRERKPLLALLDRIGSRLPSLSNSLAAAYFNHALFSV